MSLKQKRDDTGEALAEMRAVYDELANRPVERDCIRRTECCYFKLTGLTPYLTKGEAMLVAKALRATGRTKLPTPKHDGCPMLDNAGKCLIYENRPFGCRTHFCSAAGGPYSRREVLDLIRRLEAVDARLGGSGSVALPAAVERELREIS